MKHVLPVMMVLSGLLISPVTRGEEVATQNGVVLSGDGLTQVAERATLANAFPTKAAGRTIDASFDSGRPAAAAGLVRPSSDYENERNARALRAWKRSLIPVAASQALDISSSYGMRELNPMLAGPDGRFGARATAIKLSTSAALVGAEYLIIRKWPSSARWLSKLNWANAVLTGSFAAHNFAIK